MGTVFGAVVMISTAGMAIGPWAGGYVFDHFGGYWWLYIGSCAIGLGAAVIACASARRTPNRFPTCARHSTVPRR